MIKRKQSFITLSAVLDDALKDYIEDSETLAGVIQQVSYILHQEYKIEEVWWFNPYEGDSLAESVLSRMRNMFPVSEQKVAELLFMQGYELVKYRIVHCYCSEDDENVENPIPRPYDHIDRGTWGHRVQQALPDGLPEDFKEMLVSNIHFYLMTVTPTITEWKIAGVTTTDEKVLNLLIGRGFKVDSATVKNCKSPD